MHTFFLLLYPQQGHQSEGSKHCWQEKPEKSVSLYICACACCCVCFIPVHYQTVLFGHIILLSWRIWKLNIDGIKRTVFYCLNYSWVKKIQLVSTVSIHLIFGVCTTSYLYRSHNKRPNWQALFWTRIFCAKRLLTSLVLRSGCSVLTRD